MAQIPKSNPIGGLIGDLRGTGAPSAGTSEVQTLTFAGTWLSGDTFRLSFMGQVTAAISWSATDATLVSNIDTALEALATIGTGGVATADSTLSTGLGDATVTFGGPLAKLAVDLIVIDDVTSDAGTLAVAETTPGVTATGRGSAAGTRYTRTSNGATYINDGTAYAPTWTLEGSVTAGSVTDSEIAADSVGTSELKDDAAETANIKDANVTVPKLSAAAALRQFTATVADLGAGADQAATQFWAAPSTGATLTAIYVVMLGSNTGVDNSNTAVIAITDNAGNSIVSKTYNTSAQPPAAGAATSLGSLDATHKVLTGGEGVKIAVTQGATADLPNFLVQLEYSCTDA